MATLTLEIPDELNAALDALSARRREPKAAIVRALLESTVAHMADPATSPATRWLDHWRGSLQGRETPAPGDERAQHLLSKHLR
jgi:hypothetical protein